MPSITLISTRHDNIGQCNSYELCRILETISPDVIFEEIPPSLFNKYYVEKTHTNLEVEAINAYQQTHYVQHVPVDSNQIPPEALFRDYQRVLKLVESVKDGDGLDYRYLVVASKRQAEIYGFNYINSDHYNKYIEELYNAIEAGLQKLNDNTLSYVYRLWNEYNDHRENEMLRNIYTLSKENSYEQAVLLLGAAHRKSIIGKINLLKNNEEPRLNWSIYGS